MGAAHNQTAWHTPKRKYHCVLEMTDVRVCRDVYEKMSKRRPPNVRALQCNEWAMWAMSQRLDERVHMLCFTLRLIVDCSGYSIRASRWAFKKSWSPDPGCSLLYHRSHFGSRYFSPSSSTQAFLASVRASISWRSAFFRKPFSHRQHHGSAALHIEIPTTYCRDARWSCQSSCRSSTLQQGETVCQNKNSLNLSET